MASISSPYPNSFQLQFVHRTQRSSSVFVKIRARPSIRRIWLISASAGAGNSPDSFAGWSGSDSEAGSDESKKEKKGDRFGGMLGVGLAGVFFTVGVTFASLYLSGRATSGVKQQMEPLTTEQEVILTCDDQIAEVDQITNKVNVVPQGNQSKLDDYNPDCQTGLHPHIEHIEDSTGSSSLDISHDSHSETSLANPESSSNGVDSIHNVSSQYDFQIGLIDDIPIPSTPSPGLPEFSANNNVDFSVDPTSFKGSHNTMFSASLDQTIEHNTKQSIVDSTTQLSDQEGSTTHLDVPLDFTSEFEGQPQSIPLTSNLTVLESGDIVESQDSISEVADTETFVSEEDIIKHTDMVQFPTRVSTLNFKVKETLQSVPSGTVSGSDLDQNKMLMFPKESMDTSESFIVEDNAPYVQYSEVVLADTSHSQIGRTSIFESTLPEKPISYAGRPAPSLVSAALQVPCGKVLVPAIVDQVQGQALAALQVLKVIEADVQPGDICTRREYARWLVSASSVLSRFWLIVSRSSRSSNSEPEAESLTVDCIKNNA